MSLRRERFFFEKKNKKGETQTTSLDPTLMAHRNTICARSVRSPSRALATNTASLITFASNTCASPKSADGILSRGRCDETTTTLTTNQKIQSMFLRCCCCFVLGEGETTNNSEQQTAQRVRGFGGSVWCSCVSFAVASKPSCSSSRGRCANHELSLVELVNAHDAGRSCATL